MNALISAAARALDAAVKRRPALSSVAFVASGSERFLRPSGACISPPRHTICDGGQR